MKTLVWIIIAIVVALGAYFLQKNYAKDQKPEPRAPKVTPPNKPTETGGIRNWRSVKKVRDLSDQHTKDLQDVME